MAKKAKRILVLFLTVILCVVSVITPAMAENTEDPAPVENPAPASDPAPAPAPAPASNPAPASEPAPASNPAPASYEAPKPGTTKDEATGQNLNVSASTSTEGNKTTVTVTWTSEGASGSEGGSSEGGSSEGGSSEGGSSEGGSSEGGSSEGGSSEGGSSEGGSSEGGSSEGGSSEGGSSEGGSSEGGSSEGGSSEDGSSEGSTGSDEISSDVVINGVQTTVTTSNSTVITGEETREWVVKDDGNEPGQPEVKVELKPGEGPTTGTATEDPVITDNPQQGANDPNYNYTETIITDRTVEATTSEGKITVDTSGQGNFTPIQTDRDMIGNSVNLGDASGDTVDNGNQLHTHRKTSYYDTANPNVTPNNKPKPEGGYDFLYTGFGQMSDFYVGLKAENPDGTTTTAHSGALQFELIQLQDPETEGGNYTYDTKKDLFTAYCCDVTTDAVGGYWYKLDNLEDAGYYDEDSAAHIRSIATSGYWGTDDTLQTDKEGNTYYNVGSLNKLKQEMKAKAAELGLTPEQIDAITPGQALAATQAAIWTYANDETGGNVVDTDRLIIPGYKAPSNDPEDNDPSVVDPTADDFAKANAVFQYLLGLEPTAKEESTEIIDKDSYIKEDSMSITVGDKVSGHANNQDGKKDNDVYDVAINFALVVTPSENGDDLVVQVVRFSADGEPIVAAQGRIAGDGSNDENFNEVEYNDQTGEYSLKNLALAENSDFSFDLKLVGTQHLQEGVYIFNSEVKNGTPSQTFVGIAEGDKEVNISQSFVISFDVDENDIYRQTKRWKSTNTKSSRNPSRPSGSSSKVSLVLTANIEDDPVPLSADGAPEEVLEEILDLEVPLAAAPETGDNSLVYALMSLISLCGIILLAKKREFAK